MSNEDKNQTPPNSSHETDSYPDSMEREMKKYGITQVQTQTYLYGEYKYGSLVDALAQAKRNAKSERS